MHGCWGRSRWSIGPSAAGSAGPRAWTCPANRRACPTPQTVPPRRRARVADGRHPVAGHRAGALGGHAVAGRRELLAAVANGGQLVTPHLVSGLGLPASDDEQPARSSRHDAWANGSSPRRPRRCDYLSPDDAIHIPSPQPIAGLEPSTLRPFAADWTGRQRSPRHGPAALDMKRSRWPARQAPPGRSGTCRTCLVRRLRSGRPTRVALVVVLEHAGNADETAGPVARRLVLEMENLVISREQIS